MGEEMCFVVQQDLPKIWEFGSEIPYFCLFRMGEKRWKCTRSQQKKDNMHAWFFSAASLQLCSVPAQPLSRSVANSRKRSFVNWHGAGSRGLSFSPWLFNCWRNACVLQTKSSDLSRTRNKQTCSGAGGQPTGHIEITAWQPSRKEKQTPDQWKPLLRHTCPRLPV